ncbi:protein FMP32, mitochondrial [Aspergillus awamori]|uniref:Protein FMP32, mitochondrial n=1 Tax=Aspergillus awamori TaxID=105351 RepID=A0A401KYE9_ASPAW|nr:protein FMP32, mitochondrial [Aspergillus awamori]
MVTDILTRRLFILPNGQLFRTSLSSQFLCYGWFKDCDTSCWEVRSTVQPGIVMINQIPKNQLPNRIKTFFSAASLFAALFYRRCIRDDWILFLNRSKGCTVLNGSCTLEYARVPTRAADLFIPLIKQLHEEWNDNFQIIHKRLAQTRTELLIANGKDPNLIRILLHDARLWDQLREISEEQLHALLSLQTIYSRKQWFVMHEGFNSDSDEWKNFTGTLLQLREHNNEHFDQVTEKSQDLIKLEFNLMSIAEAQKSTSLNKSMKRLSWITLTPSVAESHGAPEICDRVAPFPYSPSDLERLLCPYYYHFSPDYRPTSEAPTRATYVPATSRDLGTSSIARRFPSTTKPTSQPAAPLGNPIRHNGVYVAAFTPARRAFHASASRQRDHHFDTLKFVQRLKDEGFSEEQAVAMMRVLNDVIQESIQNLTRTMVLREDTERSAYTQKVDFAKLRSELLNADSTEAQLTRSSHEKIAADLAKLNSRLRDEIGRTQASVRLDLNLEKGRIREEANGQEMRIKETETRIEQEVAGLRERVEAVKFSTLQWLMGVCTGTAALILGAWRLFM